MLMADANWAIVGLYMVFGLYYATGVLGLYVLLAPKEPTGPRQLGAWAVSFFWPITLPVLGMVLLATLVGVVNESQSP
jgi:hypothetical protein